MLVELKSLKPNPLRDFTVDPVDEDRVKDLKDSIEEDGFWGGVVGRRIKGGEIQVAAGWHRVKAAIAAGLRSADIFIAPQMTDGDMVRIYCRENATQRGNSGTAQAGSIAAAVRILAKALATGNLVPIGTRLTKRGIEVATGTMASGDGIGVGLIEELLSDIPGMSHRVVQEQLGILKASGQYARLIEEVKEEIEEENREALAKLKKAEEEQRKADEQAAKAEAERKEAAAKAKAAKEEADRKRAELAERRAEEEAKLAAKRQREAEAGLKQFQDLKKTRDVLDQATGTASKTPITFDQIGVQEHLTKTGHIAAFKTLVTSPGVQPYVKVSQQARLAKDLVAEAGGEENLTVAFMREHIITLARYGRKERTTLSKEEREEREHADTVAKYRRLVEEFGTALRAMIRTGNDLAKLEEKWPRGEKKPISMALRHDVELAKKIIDRMLRTF